MAALKARVALIWLPSSPPHHCERWNYLIVKVVAGGICTKTEAAQAQAAPSLMLMCIWNIRHVFFFQTKPPLDPALAGSKEDLLWCHTQQGPEMGHQLYPQ